MFGFDVEQGFTVLQQWFVNSSFGYEVSSCYATVSEVGKQLTWVIS